MPAAPAPSRMRREIEEIPDAVDRVLAAAPEDLRAVAEAVERLRPRWVMVAARGTSDHAAVYAQYLIETHLGLPSGLAKPSVTTVYGARLAWRDRRRSMNTVRRQRRRSPRTDSCDDRSREATPMSGGELRPANARMKRTNRAFLTSCRTCNRLSDDDPAIGQPARRRTSSLQGSPALRPRDSAG